MPAGNVPDDLTFMEDSFNSYLDKLARGESTTADDVEPTLAETALRVRAMAAKTNSEIEMMRNVWSTVQVWTGGDAAGQLPGTLIPGVNRLGTWSGERRRKRTWWFANHAAMVAVLVVALVTGYLGLGGEVPGGGSNQPTGTSLADPASTPYAVTDAKCTTEPTTAKDVESVVASLIAPAGANDTTILREAPDAETIAGVQATQQQLIACAMAPLRYYALLSENCLRSQVVIKDADEPQVELKPGMVETAVAGQEATAQVKQETAIAFATPGGIHVGTYEVVYADDIELLSDGRVGALVRHLNVGAETVLLPQNPTYRFFVKDGDRWLYDCDAPVSRG
jgi:hypothetical protein